MKNRNKISILIILIVIGFASITTTLIVRNNIGIASNLSDFDVYFSEAILDDIDVSSDVISTDGKNITFATRKLENEGETTSLHYKVKNASTQYNAEVSVMCSLENINDEYDANEYIEFSNLMSSELILAGQESDGILKVKLKKAAVKEMQANLTCKLVINASERTIEDDNEYLKENQTYNFSGIILDELGNPLTNKTLVLLPEPIIIVRTDENGYINIPELSQKYNELIIVSDDVTESELKQMSMEELREKSILTTPITVNTGDITFENSLETREVEIVQNPLPKATYDLYGYVLNDNNSILSSGSLVVYSDTPHYSSIDSRGYFYINGLEEGSHEIYYLNDSINNIKQMNKQEIKKKALGNANITTSTKKISMSNNYTISNFIIERETNRKYNINLNATGGKVSISSMEVIQNHEYGNLPTPTRTGYTFMGWYLDETKIENDFLVIPSQSHTLSAVWKANSYSISFDSNGGSSISTTLNGVYDEIYGNLPVPTRTGYTFDGWHTSASGGTKIESTSKVNITSNQTLYAHWNINKYTVSITKGTGISTVTGEGTYNYGENVTITATASTGYTWSKWTGGKESTSSSLTFTMPASNITITANATINSYILSFDSMGGSSVASKTLNYNSAYGTLTTPTWSGYTFNGWYTAKSGGTKVTTTTKMAAKNVTLYAQWSKNSVAKGDGVLDYGTVKNWIVLSVSGDNIKLVSKSPVGSWTESKEAPATEVTRINTASQAYVLKNSGGTTIATPSGNLTLADVNTYMGSSYSLDKVVSNSLFNSGNYWLATNCTERYGGPYYISAGTVKYAYYADGYVDTFSLRPVVTISKSHLKWNSSTKVWNVI